MYTIYVNDSPLTLVNEDEKVEHSFTLRYTNKPKFFLQITGTLEGGGHPLGTQVICQDLEKAWKDFQKHHEWIAAAGGAVINDGRLLCIYRRGNWDLPKGKIDEGESRDEAALREVEEETGLKRLILGAALPTTYHTYYTHKGKRVLKPTYWYLMQSLDVELIPQTEEDIEEARWVAVSELPAILEKMYPSLHQVVEAATAQL